MNIKAISLTAIMFSALALSGCSHDPVPDDVRPISQDEVKKGINAQTAPESKPTVQPSMGAGVVPDATPAKSTAPIEKGTVIMVPSTKEVSVVKNEKVELYAGQLKAGTTVKAVLFYSAEGQNNKTLPLGEETVAESGEVTQQVILPENLASGLYMISLDVNGALYTAPIKVG